MYTRRQAEDWGENESGDAFSNLCLHNKSIKYVWGVYLRRNDGSLRPFEGSKLRSCSRHAVNHYSCVSFKTRWFWFLRCLLLATWLFKYTVMKGCTIFERCCIFYFYWKFIILLCGDSLTLIYTQNTSENDTRAHTQTRILFYHISASVAQSFSALPQWLISRISGHHHCHKLEFRLWGCRKGT